MNVSMGVPMSYQLQVYDPDGDNVTAWLDADIPGASFNSDTLVFNWTPQDLDPVTVQWVRGWRSWNYLSLNL